jgi:hypothetical protein
MKIIKRRTEEMKDNFNKELGLLNIPVSKELM